MGNTQTRTSDIDEIALGFFWDDHKSFSHTLSLRSWGCHFGLEPPSGQSLKESISKESSKTGWKMDRYETKREKRPHDIVWTGIKLFLKLAFHFTVKSFFPSACLIDEYIWNFLLLLVNNTLLLIFIFIDIYLSINRGFPGDPVVKNLPANAGDTGGMGSIPGSGRSSEEGNDNPLQYSCLENPMNSGAWGGYSPWSWKELDMTEHMCIALSYGYFF